MTFDSGRLFTQQATLTNPGGSPTAVSIELWRDDQVEVDTAGQVLSDWTAMFPSGTDVQPFAEVQSGGRLFWVVGETQDRSSLLTGAPMFVEAHLRAAYRSTTTATIYRDGDTSNINDAGDPVEDTTTVAAGVTISITQIALSVPGELDQRTVHRLVGWVDATVDVQRGDRIETADGTTYGVEKVTPPAMDTGLRDQRLELVRLT